ncbi:uncharacterized protein LOC124939495 [Impatiens glandulifera]|uniref:uncharacterized protein LOC124939495 n=1 Tax=Impatiens glandulifera TaxID=253017 RepID=UPI001FB06612|nr:uncharacterized protein LOC124939495 [Impatiens glandulifera]
MGNCLFGGMGVDIATNNEPIKVITYNGGVMEIIAPITVQCITDEFPNHGIFRSQDLFWKPLAHTEFLLSGQSYHLLPMTGLTNGQAGDQLGHVRSNSVPPVGSLTTPYRMSFHHRHGSTLKRSHTEVFSRYRGGGSSTGFWKVKLVIRPKQLREILEEEAQTEELIENVRTVAKCGNVIGLSYLGFSDQWSLSSSRNASSNKDNDFFEINSI